MTRTMGSFAGLVALTVSLGGCAIQQLNQDIDATQGRISDKERQLQAQQQQQAALAAERDQLQRTLATLATQRDQLLSELRSREFSLAQLRAKLDQMRAVNDSAPATTPQQRQLKDTRARKLAEASKRAQTLEQDKTASAQDKAKQTEAMKEDARRMLLILLDS